MNMQKKIKEFFSRSDRQYGMVFALFSIIILFQILTGGMIFRPLNVTNIILQNSYIMILAIGMLFCILTGNVDLSVGSIAALVGAISGVLIINRQMDTIPAVLISLAIGALIGVWNGFWIAYIRIPAFIVTLGGMLIFRGLTMVILQGKTLGPFLASYQIISSGFIPNFFDNDRFHLTTMIIGIICIGGYTFFEISKYQKRKSYVDKTGGFFIFILTLLIVDTTLLLLSYLLALYQGIPTVMVLLTALIFAYSFVTNRTTLGRHVYAFGGNETAARLSGVKTNRVFFWVYVNMGILAALTGIVYAGRLNAATPKAGTNFELDAIAACYIGGASASGGIGTVAGAIIGSLVMGVLNNGMSIMGIGIDWQQAIKGVVLILAVAFDMTSKNKMK
jgi:putative multiple sugar transport system permease protein